MDFYLKSVGQTRVLWGCEKLIYPRYLYVEGNLPDDVPTGNKPFYLQRWPELPLHPVRGLTLGCAGRVEKVIEAQKADGYVLVGTQDLAQVVADLVIYGPADPPNRGTRILDYTKVFQAGKRASIVDVLLLPPGNLFMLQMSGFPLQDIPPLSRANQGPWCL